MILTLIEKIEIDGTEVYFYDGIDFDLIRRHKKEDGFLIFFVDRYIDAIKAWERQNRIDCVLEGKDPEEFSSDEFQNDSIAIYQTSGCLMQVYEAIKGKLIGPSKPWNPLR